MKRILLCGFILLGLPVFAVNAQGDGLKPEVTASLQTAVDDSVAQGDPGVVLWVDTPQGTFEGVGGYADVDAGTPLQADDAFRIGSITKTFTATVILQLMEEGTLTLDDPLDQWLPDVAAQLPYGDAITLRQLLNHTAGVFNFTEDEEIAAKYLAEVEMQQHQWTFAEVLDVVFPHEANFTPGEAFAYSNSNYILLGMVIEEATGQSLAESYRTRIFDPLEMTHTYLSDFEEPTAELVRGYSDELGTDDYNGSVFSSAGGIVSNAPDLVVFMRALFAGELFAESTTLDMMLTTTELSKDTLAGAEYGLGILRFDTPLGDGYAHDGQVFGFNAMLAYFPEADTVMVMLTNNDVSDVNLGAVLMALTLLPETETTP